MLYIYGVSRASFCKIHLSLTGVGYEITNHRDNFLGPVLIIELEGTEKQGGVGLSFGISGHESVRVLCVCEYGRDKAFGKVVKGYGVQSRFGIDKGSIGPCTRVGPLQEVTMSVKESRSTMNLQTLNFEPIHASWPTGLSYSARPIVLGCMLSVTRIT